MSEWLTNSDIAKLTGLKLDTIYTYRKRKTLPEPDRYVGRTPVWNKHTIEEWNSTRNQLEKEVEAV